MQLVGRTDELVEEFYAVKVDRRTAHPCVAAITERASEQLLGP